MRTSPSAPPAGYAVAVASIAIAFTIKLLLHPLLGGQSPYLLFTVAVVIAAWYGGIAAGLLATALGALLGTHFFVPSFFSVPLPAQADLTQLILFLVVGVLISWIGQSRLTGISLTLAAAEAQRQGEERYLATL
jgi:K+-sensing histidine kinase KdpD